MATHHALPRRLPQPLRRTRGELGSLLDMLPPSLDLLSPGLMARQGVELLANVANPSRFLSVLTSAQSHLREASVPVLIKQQREGVDLAPVAELSRSQRRWLGQLALELYFTQLFRSEVAIVDLWPSRFGIDDSGDAVWAPRPFYLRWDAKFRRGLQDVYAGFFLDDQERLEHGVHSLGLGSSAEALVAHFGSGNQRSVRFETHALRRTLVEIARQRRDAKQPLHPNFIAFGLYLVSLHDLLEALDMRFDVRAAFKRAYPRSQR